MGRHIIDVHKEGKLKLNCRSAVWLKFVQVAPFLLLSTLICWGCSVSIEDGAISNPDTTEDLGGLSDGAIALDEGVGLIGDATQTSFDIGVLDAAPEEQSPDASITDMSQPPAEPSHPNYLSQSRLFQCDGQPSSSPRRIRRINRKEWTRSVGQSVRSDASRNPLYENAGALFPTYSQDMTLDPATLDQFLAVNSIPGRSWVEIYGDTRLDLVKDLRTELYCFQRVAEMPDENEVELPDENEVELPDEACIETFVRLLLERGVLFRRATDIEVSQLIEFANQNLSQEISSGQTRAQTIVKITRAAWLTSGALFRTEMGTTSDSDGRWALSDDEVALALAHGLSHHMPGAPTYVYYDNQPRGFLSDIGDAARDGSIRNPSVIAGFVRQYAGGMDPGTLGADENTDDLHPSFDSCICPDGFVTSGIERPCVDIDECANADCGDGGTCTESEGELVAGQFTCLCADGYVGGGLNRPCSRVQACTDVDCGPGGVCGEVDEDNVDGAYMCTCQDGYAGGGINTPCADVDECVIDNGGCAQNCDDDGENCTPRVPCINTIGGNTCECRVPGGVRTLAIHLRAGRTDLRQDFNTSERARRGEYYLSEKVRDFFRSWLGYADVAAIFKDRPEATSAYDDGGTSVYRELLDDMIARVVVQDTEVLRNLLTTRHFYVPSSVSTPHGGAPVAGNLYGIDSANLPIGDNRAARWVELPENERAGVLTHPAWLAAHGGNFENDPSVIHRGKWVREHLLCELVPDVPITVEAQLDADTVHLSARDRIFSKTEADPQCVGCHSLMNPLGYPFEIYNHAGFLRAEDHGGPPNGEAVLRYMPEPELNVGVTDAIDMMERLADSAHVKRCFIRQNFRYFMGRNETYADACTLAAMEASYDENGGSMIEMLSTVFTSDTFLYRMDSPEVEQ